MQPERTCKTCQQTKPAAEFYQRRDGSLISPCKECAKAKSRRWYAENTERMRARQAAYDSANAVRLREAAREWRAANPEKKARSDAAWRERNREQERERSREYYLRNLEKLRAQHRERARLHPEKAAKWATENPELARMAKRNRQAKRRASLTSSFVEHVDGYVVLERDGRTCHICGEAIPAVAWPDPASFSMDHVVPLSRGGEHSYANIRAAHLLCNIRKSASTPSESRAA